MKLLKIPANTLTATVTLLSPYCPDLSATALVEALRGHDTHNLLNKHQAAEVLGVSWYTVVEWAKSGKVPAVKLPGGQWRFPSDKLAGLEGNEDA